MIAYLDLPSGLSGDMFLGCLVDGGWAVDDLRRVIACLPLTAGDIRIESKSVMRGPIRATHVVVEAAESHHHRNLDNVRKIIEGSSLPTEVKARAVAVFLRLAHAEAEVHGTTPDRIHFHEVGALDAIADIVGCCAGLHAMGIERLHASAVPLASGWTGSAHGPLPLPAPATLKLLSSVSAPICPPPAPPRPRSHAPVSASAELAIHKHHHHHADSDAAPPPPKELVTPTAAALLAELATFSQPAMRLHRVGIGAGTFQFPWPNIARLWLGESDVASSLVQIDTNIDNMNPQLFAPVMERLLSAGAVDVWLTPIQMKKGRPAQLLSVLAPASAEAALAEVLLRETTTLGVRVHPVQRHEAARELRMLDTPHGQIRVKLKLHEGKIIAAMPEYEDCRRIAEQSSLPVREIYEQAMAIARAKFLGAV